MSKLKEIENIRENYGKKINNLQREIDGLVHERDLKITRIQNECSHKSRYTSGTQILICMNCGKVLKH